MGVSKNNGTPKSSILIGFSIINHPFWGTPPKSCNGSSQALKNWKFRHHDLPLPPPFLAFDLSHKSQPGIEPRFHLGETVRPGMVGASKNLGNLVLVVEKTRKKLDHGTPNIRVTIKKIFEITTAKKINTSKWDFNYQPQLVMPNRM